MKETELRWRHSLVVDSTFETLLKRELRVKYKII